jgi:hypothetical protein
MKEWINNNMGMITALMVCVPCLIADGVALWEALTENSLIDIIWDLFERKK